MWAASCLASCCASATCGLCSSVASCVSRCSARLGYCALFGLSLILSWLLRELAAPLLQKISCINNFVHTPPKEWFQIDALLRLSLGNLLFFLSFLVSRTRTIGVTRGTMGDGPSKLGFGFCLLRSCFLCPTL